MKYRVGVLGHYGAEYDICDGQTVKTRNLVISLKTQRDISVHIADTYYYKKNTVKLLLDTLRCILTCEHIFLMVSVNGMKFYLPFLYYINKIFQRHIYHYVIGSELLEMVRTNKKLVKYLNALDVNWFEYESGTRYLRSQGVKNTVTLPNFKMITPVKKPGKYEMIQGIYRFCTFSRVMEEKGITEAIEAICRINAEENKIVATLDIYGPVEPSYATKLKELLVENESCVTYKGVVDSQHSVKVLKDYYALLFPTRWAGEGVPGTVIDAFASGIPVIASDWNANKELIQDQVQGILYPNNQVCNLKDAVKWAIDNKEIMDRMRFASRKMFEKYLPETILNTILEEMEKRER